MEKKTILAVVLSIMVLVGFYVIQGAYSPKPAVPQGAGTGAESSAVSAESGTQQTVSGQPLSSDSAGSVAANTGGVTPAGSTDNNLAASEPPPQSEDYVTIETELVTVVLTNAGGDIVSLKLKNHKEKGEPVEMIFSGSSEAHAFNVAFGGSGVQPETSYFHVTRISDHIVQFYRDFFVTANNETSSFRLTKRYEFKPNDYMFELKVDLDRGNSSTGFNFGGSAYTLAFGPQIGPRFEKLDNRYDYRRYMTFTNGKLKQEKLNNVINNRPSWAAISGKYFTLIAYPLMLTQNQYDIVFSAKEEPGLPSASRLNIVRPAVNASRVEDTYRFYIGPKTQEALAVYNTGANAFAMRDTQLVEAASTRGILSWLERALKWLLLLFYRLVHNYGVAIILLTLFVKIIFFPLTKKGSEATLRMQALAPKIKELQTKYKDNPQKLNAEMAAFYKAEGYNPLSGCLPMLLQIPIFFAMYNLFNNHFDLRGAMFIPHWIPDLSLPEHIWLFPGDFRLPLLGWTALRLLPFIYVGSQLLYGKVTQTPDQQGNTQMKMMLYDMPSMFFFILYNVPSGLLIYWIFSNVLTMVQQVGLNRYNAKKKAAQAVNNDPVIAPKKKKK
jgi:YidC/Oxa1 family membrane protein insertase